MIAHVITFVLISLYLVHGAFAVTAPAYYSYQVPGNDGSCAGDFEVTTNVAEIRENAGYTGDSPPASVCRKKETFDHDLYEFFTASGPEESMCVAEGGQFIADEATCAEYDLPGVVEAFEAVLPGDDRVDADGNPAEIYGNSIPSGCYMPVNTGSGWFDGLYGTRFHDERDETPDGTPSTSYAPICIRPRSNSYYTYRAINSVTVTTYDSFDMTSDSDTCETHFGDEWSSVDHISDCKDYASITGQTYGSSSGWEAGHPGECFVSYSNGNVYFNTLDGSHDYESKKVCKKTDCATQLGPGYEPVKNIAECRDYAVDMVSPNLLADAFALDDDANKPSGCYYHTTLKKFLLNTHETGSSAGNYRQICRKKNDSVHGYEFYQGEVAEAACKSGRGQAVFDEPTCSQIPRNGANYAVQSNEADGAYRPSGCSMDIRQGNINFYPDLDETPAATNGEDTNHITMCIRPICPAGQGASDIMYSVSQSVESCHDQLGAEWYDVNIPPYGYNVDDEGIIFAAFQINMRIASISIAISAIINATL